MQNWIGKSFGCEIDFKIEGNKEIDKIKCLPVFSFLGISVDHPISKFYEKDPAFPDFKKMFKTGQEESIAQAEKIGFKTNLYAIHPLDEEIKFLYILQILF